MRSQASLRLRPPLPRPVEKTVNWIATLSTGWWAVACVCGVYQKATPAVDGILCGCGRHHDRPA